ncbi:MAG: rhomboid family intramembrane serine protease, partial [Acidimicrobiia bacterium]
MLPIRDLNPTRIKPWITLAFIAASVVVFFAFQTQDTAEDQAEFLYRRAAIACEIRTGEPLSGAEIANGVCDAGPETPVFPEKQPLVAMLSSMFLHGGLGHLLFNMWSLWIFGNNVE